MEQQQQQLQQLKDLANDKNIRDSRKLYQYAQAKGLGFVTQKLATEALRDSVARQVLAPPPSGRGHFASSRPGQDIQADLIDFSKNTSQKNEHRYAVVGADVFTRKVAIEPVKTKTAATVRGAMRNILRELDADEEDGERRPALIRTDQGNEFASLNNEKDIHQARDVRDTNGLAVVDRAIKTIKRDLAAEVGKAKGTKWADVAEKVVQDHNSKPSPAVFGAPENVTKNPVQQFKVLQRNADNYELDKKQTERQKAAVRQADFVREPVDNGGRSFKPEYGPAIPVENVDSEYVYHKGWKDDLAKGGSGEKYTTLLKQAQAATPGNFKEKLTLDLDKVHSFNQVKQVLKGQAQNLELQLLKDGAIKTSELQRRVPGLKRAVGRYKNLTDTNWLTKVYKDKFVIQDGEVRLKKKPGSAPAANSGSSNPAPPTASAFPPAREGGSSSSTALPANYSRPALVFRGAVEVPKRTREQIQEAKRLADELKEKHRQEKRMAQINKEHQEQMRKLDRVFKRMK